MICKSPKDRVVGPLPNSYSWLLNGGDPITTYIHWEPILQAEWLFQIQGAGSWQMSRDREALLGRVVPLKSDFTPSFG